MAHPALEIKNLNAWYDDQTHVLKGINLTVMPGQVIGLLGNNGSGRTTTLRSLLGLTGTRTGSVKVNGIESIHMPPRKIAHLGISYGPDELTLLDELSCEENLLKPMQEAETLGGGVSLADIYEFIPLLRHFRHHPVAHLSTPERQLLAVAKVLRQGTNILLLDEISDSITPNIAQVLRHAISALKKQGYTIVMADHQPGAAAMVTDYFYVIKNGQLLNSFPPMPAWSEADPQPALPLAASPIQLQPACSPTPDNSR
jgi:branched-chain amino acid transport system ATP-binding protein